MGADVVIDPSEADPVRQIFDETAGRGVDVTIDCAAKGGSINQSLRATRNAGRVVITGVPSELQVALDFHTLRRKELSFYSVRRSNREFESALRLLADSPGKFAPILTHQRKLDEIQPAFEMLEAYQGGVGKITIVI
jgi:threonine dehydrogenase-like Zn-dependent dehydrogenase